MYETWLEFPERWVGGGGGGGLRNNPFSGGGMDIFWIFFGYFLDYITVFLVPDVSQAAGKIQTGCQGKHISWINKTQSLNLYVEY